MYENEASNVLDDVKLYSQELVKISFREIKVFLQ